MNAKFQILIIALAIVTVSSSAFAERYERSAGKKVTILYGTISTINTDKELLVLKDRESGRSRTIHVAKSQLSSLNAGDAIEVVLEGVSGIASRVSR